MVITTTRLLESNDRSQANGVRDTGAANAILNYIQ